MSNTTTVKGRIQNKHDTEANWLKSVYKNGDPAQGLLSNPFIPLAGELIIYDPDNIHARPRTKYGDGTHNVVELPFVVEPDLFAEKSEGAFFIQGSGTTNSTTKLSKWVGTSDRITDYYDGLTIKYKIGIAGQTTTTLNINGLGEEPVYLFNTTKLTTQFPVGSIIHLTYHTDLNNGCWMCSDYDANTNTYQRVYATTTDEEYPITARYNVTTGSSYYAEYGRYSDSVTLNPSTQTITAAKFKGALVGNADTATKATQDGDGNNIASTYATKDEIETYVNEAILGGTW